MSAAATVHCSIQPPPVPVRVSQSKSQTAFSWKLFAAALFIGILVQAAGPNWLKSVFVADRLPAFEKALMLLTAIAASVSLHELGHLIPSLCFGFHVSRVSVGPVSLARLGSAWKLQYSRNWFSGSVSAVPANDRAWRLRMLAVVAAGPLASLALFLLAGYEMNRLTAYPSLFVFAKSLAEINFFIALLGLIPNSEDAQVRNDARLFWTILRNRSQAEQIKLYQQVTRLQINAVRPRDYPQQLIERLACSRGTSDLILFSAHTIYLWALDSGEIATAAAWDRYATALIEEQNLRLRNIVLCESAYFDLVHRGDSISACKKLNETNFTALPGSLLHRSNAVRQLAMRNYPEALMNIEKARAGLNDPRSCFAFELILLDFLERQVAMRTDEHRPRAMHAAA